MKIKVQKKHSFAPGTISINLAIMVVALILGIASGCIFAAKADSDVLTNLIGSDITIISQNESSDYSLFKTFFNLAKYPVLSLFLSFSAFGVILIPLVVFTKGFLLSLSVSSVISVLGKKGIFTALSMFGVQSLVSIPCLLLLTAVGFEFSKPFALLAGPSKGQIPQKRIKTGSTLILFSFLLILVFLAAIVDTFLTPILVSIATKSTL